MYYTTQIKLHYKNAISITYESRLKSTQKMGAFLSLTPPPLPFRKQSLGVKEFESSCPPAVRLCNRV